jgi:hypothetical protein
MAAGFIHLGVRRASQLRPAMQLLRSEWVAELERRSALALTAPAILPSAILLGPVFS